MNEALARGRKPLPPGQALSVPLYFRVRSSEAARFKTACAERQIEPPDALREALAQWLDPETDDGTSFAKALAKADEDMAAHSLVPGLDDKHPFGMGYWFRGLWHRAQPNPRPEPEEPVVKPAKAKIDWSNLPDNVDPADLMEQL